MSATPYQLAFAQRDYIYNLFKAQQNVGADGTPGTGTNLSGTLQSVASIGHRTIWPGFFALPFVGVQIDKINESIYGSNRRHAIVVFMRVGVAVKVTETLGVIMVDDAYAALETLINDGSGNGVEPILRAVGNYNLGVQPDLTVNADLTILTQATFSWNQTSMAKGVSYYAYAQIAVQGRVWRNV